MQTLTLVTALLCGANLNFPHATVYELGTSIQDRQFKKVGVLPRFIVIEGDKESLGGSLGAQADLMSADLEDKLVNFVTQRVNTFKVIDGRRLRKAFEGMTIDDLSNEESLKKIAERVGGMDALIVCTVTDQRGDAARKEDAQVRMRVIEVEGGAVALTKTETKIFTPADAALAGESFELLRWTPAGIRNVGLETKRRQKSRIYVPDDPKEISPFGKGEYYDELHYEMIRRERPHPLLDAECPYDVWVQVGEERRPATQIGGKLYVAIEPGEAYQVLVQNKGSAQAFLTLFVDGINVQGKRREQPESAKFWYLKPQGKFRFKGWMTPKEGSPNEWDQEEFVLVSGDESVAAQQGFGEQLGMITAYFTTVGMKGIPTAVPLKSKFATATIGSQNPGKFGTGAGAKSTVKLEAGADDKPGLILGSITLYYATASQIESLKAKAGQ